MAASVALSACPFCRARGANAPKVLCASGGGSAPDDSAILKSSGDDNLDRILTAELIAQADFFGLKPGFLLYSGSNQNAFASSDVMLAGTQGTILYNIDFLKGQLLSTTWGGTVVSGIIAHEFGHIYQFFSSYAQKLQALHQTVKFEELHADFLSGFYMGRKHLASPINLQDYYDQFYELGDYAFDSKDHHGTKAERYFAIKAGYNLSLGNRNARADWAAAQAELFLKEYFR